MTRAADVVISHASYTEPSFITDARDRGFAREHVAHDALAAAKAAATRPFTISALPVLLAGADPAAIDQVTAEIRRLRGEQDAYLDTLATAAWREAGVLDPIVLRPVRQLAENTYIAWAGGADAPVGFTMTWLEARAAGFPQERLVEAVEMTNDNGFNRAGPGEACLTVQAVIEAYASDEAHQAFRLTPDKIRPYLTSEMQQNPQTGQWEESDPYWVPWAPDEVPDVLPDTMREMF